MLLDSNPVFSSPLRNHIQPYCWRCTWIIFPSHSHISWIWEESIANKRQQSNQTRAPHSTNQDELTGRIAEGGVKEFLLCPALASNSWQPEQTKLWRTEPADTHLCRVLSGCGAAVQMQENKTVWKMKPAAFMILPRVNHCFYCIRQKLTSNLKPDWMLLCRSRTSGCSICFSIGGGLGVEIIFEAVECFGTLYYQCDKSVRPQHVDDNIRFCVLIISVDTDKVIYSISIVSV